jgi:hypothetical protein
MELRTTYTVKKVTDFHISSRDGSLSKLSQAGKYLIIPGQGEFSWCGDILAGDGK